ncbi:MAG: hypothetical protein U0172_03465 [Nitrospiraceae bacterium]
MLRALLVVAVLLLQVSTGVAALDPVENFAKVTVSQGYDSTTTTIVVTTGQGGRLPSTTPFSVTWWNATDYPDPSDDPQREIIRVTNRSGDTLTILRAQEGTSASTHNTAGKTYRLVQGLTKAMWAQVSTEISNTAGGILNVQDTSAYADFPTAVTNACGSTQTLRVSTAIAVASNTAPPAICTIWMDGQGQLSPNTSITITFDSPEQLRADPRRQIFGGTGTIAFTKPGTIHVGWCGAIVGDGVDDAAAIARCMAMAPSGSTVEFAAGVYRVDAELISGTNDLHIKLAQGTTLDVTNIIGTGTTGVHSSDTVIAAIKLTGLRQKVTGGRLTGVNVVSSKRTVGVHVHGASGTKIGGLKSDGLYAGIWAGNNAQDLTIQHVDLDGNGYGIILGYWPTTSGAPQVSRYTVINCHCKNSTVGDGLHLASHARDGEILGGWFSGNANMGIRGHVGGTRLVVNGVHADANTLVGLYFAYDVNTGEGANQLGYDRRLILSSNYVRANVAKGVFVAPGNYALVSSIGGVEDVTLANNIAEGNGGPGFELGLVKSSVTGNLARNNTGVGFQLGSMADVSMHGNQAWDNGTTTTPAPGFLFTLAATNGSTPPDNTRISFVGNQAGDTRSGASRSQSYGFDLDKIANSLVSDNSGENNLTADWHRTNSHTSLALLQNRGTVSSGNQIGATIGKHLRGTATWDPASTAASTRTAVTTVTVTGAAVGDVVTCAHPSITVDNLEMESTVSSSDTVKVFVYNGSGGTWDGASGTLTCEVWKP